jgi:hypothetical protein
MIPAAAFQGKSLEEVKQLVAQLPPEQKAAAYKLIRDNPVLWRPLQGPQVMAYNSDADQVGYGGAAGGGKTDLMCGTALTKHKKAMILRREATQLLGIIDRIADILGSRDGYNSQLNLWRVADPPMTIEFGSTPNPTDWMKYQGRPHDFLGLDEATNFPEIVVRALLGWLRTTIPDQRCQALLTFNPPTTAEGRWIIPFFGPWLDDKHPNPAKPGELRFFAMLNGREVEVESKLPFVLIGEDQEYDFDPKDFAPADIILPVSRTFIASRVSDNPYLTGTGYISTLQAMPEPLRSQMLKGDFKAGMEDDAYQLIPTAWVDAAMARWKPRTEKGTMDSMGVDIARGGRDEMQIARRHGTWFDEMAGVPGNQVPTGPLAATQILVHRRDRAPVHLDIIGVGSSPYDFLTENSVQVIGINGAAKAHGKTVSGNIGFVNLRAEIYWRMREALDPLNPKPIALPDDQKLKADLTAPRWMLRSNGIQVESKEEIIKRLGRSTDRGDAAVYALVDTPRDEDIESFVQNTREQNYDRYGEIETGSSSERAYDRYGDLR